MEPEFVHGTLMIDNDGAVTDTLYFDDRKIKIAVVIPPGTFGDFSSFEHHRLWASYLAVRGRIEEIVKERFPGVPTESSTITLEKSDLPAQH